MRVEDEDKYSRSSSSSCSWPDSAGLQAALTEVGPGNTASLHGIKPHTHVPWNCAAWRERLHRVAHMPDGQLSEKASTEQTDAETRRKRGDTYRE